MADKSNGVLIGPVEEGDTLDEFSVFEFTVARWPESDADLKGDAALADALKRLKDSYGR